MHRESKSSPLSVRSPDGTDIAYEQYGAGPPLIVVLGALNDRWSAKRIAQQLAPHFTVFAYDRRGRGDSGDTAPYSVRREIEDLEILVDSVAGGSAFVYGHSSGAALALEAVAAGIRIEKLAIYEPPYFSSASADPDVPARLNELIDTGRRGDAVEMFLTGAVGVPREVVAGMRQNPFWAKLESLAHTLRYDMAVMGDSNVPVGRFETIGIPILVMYGEDSSASFAQAARSIVDAVPAAQLRSFRGQDHDVAAGVLAPVLTEFFR